MYAHLRPLLFRIDPERVHGYTLTLMRLAGTFPPARGLLSRIFSSQQSKPVQVFGLDFPNVVGLAAGYDKDGLAWRGLACLGFGHIEIGTITPLPQAGNPKPRIFRLPEDEALINRMGFPGRGAEFVRRYLSRERPRGCVVGVNLGKGKDTLLGDVALDYLHLVRLFSPLADYLAINVSSPNTIGLRRLQAREYLESLLTQLDKERQGQSQSLGRRIPLLVKLAPDLSLEELEDALEVVIRTNMDGVIATNTTIERENVHSPLVNEEGGLSGVPLKARSTQVIRDIHRLTEGKLPIIGVGGVMNADDVLEKLDAGASLVQIYTGLVYRGPGLVKQILKELA